MNLDLTVQEMELLLGLTANTSYQSETNDSLWRKVSKEFVRNYREAQAREEFAKQEGMKVYAEGGTLHRKMLGM
jgi:hypothetical protein